MSSIKKYKIMPALIKLELYSPNNKTWKNQINKLIVLIHINLPHPITNIYINYTSMINKRTNLSQPTKTPSGV